MVIGVYGLGRFGSFWAESLAAHFVVKGYSRSASRITSDAVLRVDEDEVLSCDALFLCVAISSMKEVLERIASRLPEQTVVLDTCSVKVVPVDLMMSILDERTMIIGTHPMFGPDSGKDGIGGLPLCFCPARVPGADADRWFRIFGSMGLRVYQMTPQEHDRKAAYTQGITHFIGRVLGYLDLESSEIGTLGYQRLLEIIDQTCNDPLQLFLDLQRYNPYTDEMRKRLGEAFGEVRAMLMTEPGNLDTDSIANVE